MFRSLTTVQLPGNAYVKLQEIGYVYCEDLFPINTRSSNKTGNEGHTILKQWYDSPTDYWKTVTTPPITRSALDVWQEECSSPGIVTFCKAIDDSLDCGVPLRSITELCGAPGSGKTQMCLQLSVDVQIPVVFGGLGGQAVFIDTDSGFSLERLLKIAEACVHHCQKIALQQGGEDMKLQLQNFSRHSILKSIHYIHTHEYVELIAAVLQINELLQKGENVKLIVIDSLAFTFLHGIPNILRRTRLLYQLLGELQTLACSHGIAIVVTNQLTTRLFPSMESQLVPALRESFGHRMNQRLMLGCLHHSQFATVLLKSLIRPYTSMMFKILSVGIRDITEVEENLENT